MEKRVKDCDGSKKGVCDSRREFLVRAGVVAGGLVLGLTETKAAVAKDAEAVTAAPAEEFVLKLDEKSPLNRVGGFATIDTKAGKVIVVRTGDLSFKAFSAVCTHKNGPIQYDDKTQQLFCDRHGSRFDTAGQVAKGPAKTPLKTFAAQNEVVIALDAAT